MIASSLPAAKLALHAFVESLNADDDALVRAAADSLEIIMRFHRERHGPALDAHDLRRRGDPEADRRCRHVTDIEVNAEALMPRGKEMLDGRQCRRLDHVDHDRRRQHGDSSRTDKGGGVLGPDDEFGRAVNSGRDIGKSGTHFVG